MVESKFFEVLVFIYMIVLWIISVRNESDLKTWLVLPIVYSALYFLFMLFTFIPEYICYPVKINKFNANV